MENGRHTFDMVLAHTRMLTPGLAMLECGRTGSEMARENSFMPITNLSESSSTTRFVIIVQRRAIVDVISSVISVTGFFSVTVIVTVNKNILVTVTVTVNETFQLQLEL